MALGTIDEREALMAMRVATAVEAGEIPPAVQYVNGRLAQDFEKPHLAAGVLRDRAQGASAVAGLTGGRK
jgi:hypothetical protein